MNNNLKEAKRPDNMIIDWQEIERKSNIEHAKREAERKAKREATKFDRPYYINIYWEDGIYSTYYENHYEALEGATTDACHGSIADHYRKTLYVEDHKIRQKFIFTEGDIEECRIEAEHEADHIAWESNSCHFV